MQRYGIPNALDPFLCDNPFKVRAYLPLYRQLLPYSVRQGDKQDLARYYARINLCGHICAAAVAWVCQTSEDNMLYPYSSRAVRSSLIFNQDGTTAFVNDKFKKKKVRITKEAEKQMRSQHNGAKALSAPAQQQLDVIKQEGTSSSSVGRTGFVANASGDQTMRCFDRSSAKQPMVQSYFMDPDHYPPRYHAKQARGFKADILPHGTGAVVSSVLTFMDDKCKAGHRLYSLNDRFHVVFRSKKLSDEVMLAIDKEQTAFLPAMDRVREELITEYLRRSSMCQISSCCGGKNWRNKSLPRTSTSSDHTFKLEPHQRQPKQRNLRLYMRSSY